MYLNYNHSIPTPFNNGIVASETQTFAQSKSIDKQKGQKQYLEQKKIDNGFASTQMALLLMMMLSEI